jgi:hypothetical protein
MGKAAKTVALIFILARVIAKVVLGCKMKIKAKHSQAVAKNKKRLRSLDSWIFILFSCFFWGT